VLIGARKLTIVAVGLLSPWLASRGAPRPRAVAAGSRVPHPERNP